MMYATNFAESKSRPIITKIIQIIGITTRTVIKLLSRFLIIYSPFLSYKEGLLVANNKYIQRKK